MKRRDLIRAIASTGALMALPTSAARASGQSPQRYFVHISAGGGWDVTSICDPKGELRYSDSHDYMNKYKTADIRQSGNLRYAPIAPGTWVNYDWMDHVYQNYGQHMLVVNGVNCLTGSHAQGSYYQASGQSFGNFPTLAALHSAPYGNSMAMAYYSAGPHSASAGEVSPVQINSSSTLSKLVHRHPDQPQSIHDMLQGKRDAVLDHLGYDPESPSKTETWRQFANAHASRTEIVEIEAYLPSSTSSSSKFQAEMSAALLASGHCAAAAFGAGGSFDSHYDNDVVTVASTNSLFETIDHLWTELERHGIAEKTLVMIGSEFGRTPWYNSSKGKDHWSTGSFIFMSKGIRGNRTIGASTDQLKPGKVNANSLEVDENGAEITVQHIHRAIRDHLGFAGTALNSKYPMPVASLNLFG